MIQQIIIDTDGGIDDQLALLVAVGSHEVEILGVTTVSGAVSADIAAENVLTVLEMAHCLRPVYIGTSRPILRMPHPTPQAHGERGMGKVEGMITSLKAELTHAVEFMIETVKAHPGLTILTLGPLTNLALAIRLEPSLVKYIGQVVSMGGAFQCAGNITPVAEGNIFKDPEAAWICLRAGLKINFIGLDVTSKVIIGGRRLLEIPISNNLGRYVNGICNHYIDFFKRRYGIDGIYSHDPTAISYVCAPNLFGLEEAVVDIECSAGLTLGKTVWDRYLQWGRPNNARVAVNVAAVRVSEFIINKISDVAQEA